MHGAQGYTMTDQKDLQERLNELSENKELQNLLNAMNQLKVLQKRMKKINTDDVLLQAKIDALHNRIKENKKLQLLVDKVPGEVTRVEIVQKICDVINAQTYLEIGVRHGDCFSQIQVPRKIGIDPVDPKQKVKVEMQKEGVSYYQMYSDDFFKEHAGLFKENKIDVAFVDGLHTYDQSLRDSLNCLEYLSEKGVLIMHDCNPCTEATGIPAPLEEKAKECAVAKGLTLQGAWLGDVWKTVVYLRSQRPDLYVFTLRCDWGVGIAMKGISEKPLSFNVEEIDTLTYQDLEDQRDYFLNMKEQEFLFAFLKQCKNGSMRVGLSDNKICE